MNKNKITGLAIWNMILSILVFMLMVALWSTQEDLKTERQLSQMSHDSQHTSLLEVADAVARNTESITRNAESILKISEATIANSDSTYEAVEGLIYIIEIYREDHVESIAEIYQGHIIPIRAMLMDAPFKAGGP